MRARVIPLILALVATQAGASAQLVNPPDLSAYAKTSDMAAVQAQVATATGAAKTRLLYANSGSVTVGKNSSVRSSMLPPPISGTSLTIPAGRLLSGSSLMTLGAGEISARTTAPGTFNFYPNVTPAGGTKTDLGGLAVTPLIGVAGYCELWMTITQTPTGLLTSGVVKYGTNNGQSYSVIINPTAIIVASDPTVDRVLDIDFQTATADAANYVKTNAVTITYMPAS